jgi:hypothetical protein
MAIRINGSTNPKLDAVPGTTYAFDTTVTGSVYLWEIVSQPPGGTDSFSSPAVQSPTLLVRNEGSYLVRLTVTTGAGSTQYTSILAAPSFTSNARVPAYGEQLEAIYSGNAAGWDQGAGNALRSLDLYREQAGVIACVADGTIAPGDLVVVGESPSAPSVDPAAQLILSGLPGVRSLPIAFSYAGLGGALNPRVPLVGIAVGKPSGSSAVAGEVVLVRTSGLYQGLSFTRTTGTDYPLLFSNGVGGFTDADPDSEAKSRCVGRVVRWSSGTPGSGTVDVMVYGDRVPRIKTVEFGGNSSTNLSSASESYFSMGTDAPSTSVAYAQYCPQFDIESTTILASADIWAAITGAVVTTFKVYNAGSLVGASFTLASSANSASHSYYATVDTSETFQFTGQLASGSTGPRAIAATLTFWEL